jgi:hypothetical protein
MLFSLTGKNYMKFHGTENYVATPDLMLSIPTPK